MIRAAGRQGRARSEPRIYQATVLDAERIADFLDAWLTAGRRAPIIRA